MRAYCAFENRPEALTGAKLLALSLERHGRDFTFYLGVTDEPPGLSDWLRRRAPHAVLVRLSSFSGARIKQVKPVLLLHLFERGLTDITWLDTDLLVLRDPEPLLAPLDDETVLVAQDMDYAFNFHPLLLSHYGRERRRPLEHCVNTCVLRMTARHLPLLREFERALADPLFLAEMAKPPEQRSDGFGYDQRILELLLSSTGKENLPAYPVRFVPEGSGIIQELGVTTYGLRDRWRNGLGRQRPWFVHLAGVKSWDIDSQPWHRGYRAASVYSAFAETYCEEMEEPMAWPNSAGFSSRLARLLSFGQPHWMGWAHGVAGKCWRFLRTGTTKRGR